jgi:DNA-directed RNA polymerase II subunit RPB1
VKYDNTVRNSRGLIIQFLYGDDGIDATYMENIHLKLLGYTSEKLREIYYNPNIPDEFELIKQLQLDFIEIASKRDLNNAKLDDDYYPMPVNIGRVIQFARGVNIDSRAITDIEIYNEVQEFCKRISSVYDNAEEPRYSEKTRSQNATKLFRIYIHSELSTNRIKDLNRSQILYILQDIELKYKRAIVNPGEMCGILAAQSIGELTTQLTLNSFHYAGVSAKNVTLGVPRLKELINVTKKLKTPSLTMYEKNDESLGPAGHKRIIESIRSKLEYKTIQEIVKSSDIVEDEEDYKEDTATIDIYRDMYSYTDTKIPKEFISLRLCFSEKNLEYVDTSMIELSKLILEGVGPEYMVICNDDNDLGDNLFIRIMCNGEIPKEEQIDILRKIEIFCMSIKIKGCERISRVYTREAKCNKWNPEKGHYKESQWVLETEGTNLIASMQIEEIDQYRTVSNNIIEIYEIFGIEAARQALLNELKNVLSFDGSYVNYRHLSVLVDTMTCRGALTAMTRHGINRIAEAGTLAKCSFEETVEVLMDAAAFGEIDTLKGISDNIMVGQTIPSGTGSVDLIYDHEVDIDVRLPAISREPTPMAAITVYIPSEPIYDPLSKWPY